MPKTPLHRRLIASLLLFWLLLAVPAVPMLWTFAGDPATAFDLVHPSGEMAVRLVIVAMAISPLLALLGRGPVLGWLLQRRRAIGVASFGYGMLHLFFYLVDMAEWDQIVADARIAGIWTGYLALLLFGVMAATSNNAAQRALGRRWKTVQRLVYAAILLTALHWVWVDGDVIGAALYLVPLAGLEAARLIVLAKRQRRLRRQGDAC